MQSRVTLYLPVSFSSFIITKTLTLVNANHCDPVLSLSLPLHDFGQIYLKFVYVINTSTFWD